MVTAATIDYLDSGKVKTKGIVNKTFKLEQFGEALESIKNKTAIKAAIVFDDEEPEATPEEVEVAESTKAEAGDEPEAVEPEPVEAEKPEAEEKAEEKTEAIEKPEVEEKKPEEEQKKPEASS